MEYDIDYFIRKFEAIPDERWCVNVLATADGRHCVLGHCGVPCMVEMTDEAIALCQILPNATQVNDGSDFSDPYNTQPTPKARILAALRDIKAVQP